MTSTEQKSHMGEVDFQANREYKDSVFRLLFGKPEILRQLYSAIEGVDLPPDVRIDINTISGVLVKGIRNDISFTIDDRLVVLCEHQSSINANMPLRIFKYFEKILDKMVDFKKVHVTQLVKIPKPVFIVLYNGKAPFPERKTLRLSDAFMDTKGMTADKDQQTLELLVEVYNINHGQNPEMQQRCKTLNEYSLFIEKIREYERTGLSLDDSIKSAVEYCLDHDILVDFLRIHGLEVFSMMVEDYTTEDFIEAIVEEAREEGLFQGRGEERQEILALWKSGVPAEEIFKSLEQK